MQQYVHKSTADHDIFCHNLHFLPLCVLEELRKSVCIIHNKFERLIILLIILRIC